MMSESTVLTRRQMLKTVGHLAGACVLGVSTPLLASGTAGRVVVVGGGFGGATAAKYLKRRNPLIEVTLIEPSPQFYTCPFSNLYLGGLRDFDAQTHGFEELRALGVRVIQDYAQDVDAVEKTQARDRGTAWLRQAGVVARN